VSFHLSALKEAGLIKDRKQGKWIHYRIDDSDMFRRILILSVMERIPADSVLKDRKRLREFIQTKTKKINVIPLKKSKSYCGR
jgi:ArsR family transcriptional regulator